jgi:GWxTD domain-containing protein
MNRIIFFILLTFLPLSAVIAQEAAKQPRALFAAKNFYHPEKKEYVELYLSFDASSLVHVKTGLVYQATVEVLYVIRKNDKIFKYDKFAVKGPEMLEEGLYQDFVDVQKMTLEPGDYQIEIQIRDVNSNSEKVRAIQNHSIPSIDRKMGVSDIVFQKNVEETADFNPLVKNGYMMTPWLAPTLPDFLDTIFVYTEVYNSDFILGREGAYVEKQTLKNLDVDSVFETYSSIKRVKASEVNVILRQLDISQLPSGSYLYSIELFNRENELVGSQSIQFGRQSEIPRLQNPLNVAYIQDFSLLIESETNRDTIVDYFRCIRPLGDYQHQNFIDNNWKISETDILKNFIISFWLDHAKTNPKDEWLAYRNLVHQVNKEFGNSAQKGYDTDRGMVYLRYGPPNQTVIRENEPSSYPYIIWQYYTHPKQSNAMYVFYDPSLTYRDYVLLHCNVRGEKNNPRWKVILQSRNTPNNDTDQEQTGGSWGGRIDDYYENPR